MVVVVAAFVTNAESQKPRRLTQAPLQLNCSRSPLHRTAASPLQKPRKLSGLSALKVFLRASGQDASCSDLMLKGEVETAAEHSKIVFRSIDHAEAQVVGPTNMPRDSEFETSSKLADHFGFGTEVIGLRMDSERIGWPLRMNDISFAAAENRAHTRPCVGG